MLTIKELFEKIKKASKTKEIDEDLKEIDYDPYHLDCIFKPEIRPCVWDTCNTKCKDKYFIDCFFSNLDSQNNLCQSCLNKEEISDVLKSKDTMNVLKEIKEEDQPVFALIAPAFLGQFKDVRDSQLRNAFKQIGFSGMIEVSLFADILTLREALEFDKKIQKDKDFLLTSCCCPMWIAMIRKLYPKLLEYVPNSVSPMVAAGRVVKKLVPNAITVFVGPCLAKKAEAKEKDVEDAIDHVLTFQEVKDIFDVAHIDTNKIKADPREHSSMAGRLYAVTNGVSEAVRMTVNKLNPEKAIKVKAVAGNGVVECKRILDTIREDTNEFNFIEGMGCKGGCVGGPKSLINRNLAKDKVVEYAKKAHYETPLDNPYVLELLYLLGIDTIEKLILDHEIFTRKL